ncbi:MAG: Ribosomal RNA small subunit methyltransferase D [Holosporales bacterium]
MRIIAGTLRGKKLLMPPQSTTRPTSDKVRGAVFNILEHRHLSHGFKDLHVLDAFSGSGALGLEAYSRGCKSVTFAEKNKEAFGVLKKNVGLNAPNLICCQKDVTTLQFLNKFDLVFMDPPFQDHALYQKLCDHLLAQNCLSDHAIIYVEMGKDNPVSLPFNLIDERQYGAVQVQFYKNRSILNALHFENP